MIIGCQFSLYPMTDCFEKVILESIENLKKEKTLRIETDDISTMVRGDTDKIFSSIMECFLKASSKTNHVVLNVTFSHGCPGEPNEPCCNPQTGKKHSKSATYSRENKESGVFVSAQFALYPLNTPTYMDRIYEEIETAKKIVTVTPKHFCTRLDGDTTKVFEVLQNALMSASEDAAHVVITAIVSKKDSTLTHAA